MHPEKYSVTLPSYSDYLNSMMKELMTNEDLSDVTLFTEDKKQIKANINILSACSPVFKDTFKTYKNSKTIMYLRGIQYSEMESIMQFIYLGEATFYEERMNEFLSVAKSLEIKELCNAVAETEKEILFDTVISKEKVDEKTCNSYECEQCNQTYHDRSTLNRHIQSVHQGVKYACDQCDYQARYQSGLIEHIQSKHKDIKYACNQCDYQAKRHYNLIVHINSKHEGAKYACDHCGFHSGYKGDLNKHIKLKHEGVRYSCDQCDYQAIRQDRLTDHIHRKHGGIKDELDQYPEKVNLHQLINEL